jgi:hypothetical protein
MNAFLDLRPKRIPDVFSHIQMTTSMESMFKHVQAYTTQMLDVLQFVLMCT